MAGFCYTDKSRILDSASAKSNAKERAAEKSVFCGVASSLEVRSRRERPAVVRHRRGRLCYTWLAAANLSPRAGGAFRANLSTMFSQARMHSGLGCSVFALRATAECPNSNGSAPADPRPPQNSVRLLTRLSRKPSRTKNQCFRYLS